MFPRPRRCFFGILLGLLTLIGLSQAATIHVAKNGSDISGDGSSGAPYLTIQHAVDQASAGDSLQIHEGTYRETVTVTVSGSSGQPITIAAASGETVVVSGAELYEGGFSPYSGKIWRSNTPVSLPTGTDQDQVFVDGLMLLKARWPNASLDVSRPTFAEVDDHWFSSNSGGGYYWQTMHDAELTAFAAGDLDGASIYIMAGVENFAQTAVLSEHNAGNNSISAQLYLEFGDQSTYGPRTGSRYYLYGALSLLDHYGEYYVDSGGYLYLICPTGKDPNDVVVELRQRNYGFDLSNQSWLTLENIELFACSLTTHIGSYNFPGGQGDVIASTNITIDGLRGKYITHDGDLSVVNPLFDFSNRTGIVINGADHVIRNSVISYSSGNGIALFGQRNQAINNVVHDVNYMAVDGSGISTGFQNNVANDQLIERNTVLNSGRSLILLRSATNNQVRYNRIANSTLQTVDYGGIYAWGEDCQQTEVAYNIVSDCYGEAGFGAIGLYFDDGSRNIHAHHNLVYNSIVAMQINLQNQANGSWADDMEVWNNTLIGDRVSLGGVNGLAVPQGWWSSTIRNNIFNAFHTYRSATQSNNLEEGTDPLFSQPTALDFGLQAGSPAIDQGWYNSGFHPGLGVGTVDLGAFERSQPAWSAGAGSGGQPAIPSNPIADNPTQLTASYQTPTDILLSWQDNSDNETGFVVELTDEDLQDQSDPDSAVHWRPVAHLAANQSNYLLKGIAPKNYTFRVRATNGAYSNHVTVSGPKIATEYRTGVTAEGSGGGVNTSGNVVTNLQTGGWLRFDQIYFPQVLTGLEVHVQGWGSNTGGTATFRLDSLSGPVIATAVIPANMNGGQVVQTSASISAAQEGVHDLYVSFDGVISIANYSAHQFVAGAASAPTGSTLTATLNGNQVDLSWTADSDALLYQIERSRDGLHWAEIVIADASVLNWSDTGIGQDEAWLYRLRAQNLSGSSDWSYDHAYNTGPSVATPGNLQANSTSATPTSIDLSWLDNADNEDRYLIEISLNGTDGWVAWDTVAANQTNYTASGLTQGARYYFRVYGDNATLTSGYSNVASAIAGGSNPDLLAYEGWDGSASGWNGDWSAGSDTGAAADGLGLNYSGLPVEGASTATNWRSTNRDLSSPRNLSGGPLYLSYLQHVTDWPDNQFRLISLQINRNVTGQPNFSLGASGDNNASNPLTYQYAGSGLDNISTGNPPQGQTLFHLIELREDGANAAMRIWRYQSSNLPTVMPTTSDAEYVGEVTSLLGGGSVENIGLFAYNVNGAIDEIRVGNTFESVLGLGVPADPLPQPSDPYADWQQLNFFDHGLSTADAATDNDYDGDGLENLLEYAFGGDPRVPDTVGLPSVSLNGSALEITFQRQADRTDLRYVVEAADSLSGSWTNIAESNAGATTSNIAAGAVTDPGGSGTVSVTVRDGSTIAVGNPRYLRICIDKL